MLQLIKQSPRKWQGVGLGHAGATWALRDYPHVSIYSAGGDWIAVDTHTGERTSAYTRALLLEKLSARLAK